MVTRHATNLVFGLSVLLTLASIGLTVAFRDDMLILLLVSLCINLVVLYRNERGGFVRTNQIRRAYEPIRHFNVAQLATLFVSVLAQLTLGTYVLIT